MTKLWSNYCWYGFAKYAMVSFSYLLVSPLRPEVPWQGCSNAKEGEHHEKPKNAVKDVEFPVKGVADPVDSASACIFLCCLSQRWFLWCILHVSLFTTSTLQQVLIIFGQQTLLWLARMALNWELTWDQILNHVVKEGKFAKRLCVHVCVSFEPGLYLRDKVANFEVGR